MVTMKGLLVQDVVLDNGGMKSRTHGPFLVSIIYSPIKIKVHEKLKLAREGREGEKEGERD